MPPKKKTKVAGRSAHQTTVAFHQLEDIVAIILGWLCVEEIMGKRRVCKKWKEAARKTIVPLGGFCVHNMKTYNAMNVMTTALPNLQQIELSNIGVPHKYYDGEDPDRETAIATADWISHDIEITSNFSKLRILAISNASLNGRYPFLFNSFPLLQKLTIYYSKCLKWDLEMLSGLPLLKELYCIGNERVIGNINSLRALKETLEVVKINICRHVEGNFMDLADFPHLKVLNLPWAAVTGDIRDIGENDFPSLEDLDLPRGVYGGCFYELQRISDAPDLVRAVYLLKKQRPAMIMGNWYAELSEDSPDWYDYPEEEDAIQHPPPLLIHFVQAGSRVGYRWISEYGNVPCEVNWLDPEPDRESSGYNDYMKELKDIEDEVTTYRGYRQPPTEEEYQMLCISRN